jgi:hypothetical protein
MVAVCIQPNSDRRTRGSKKREGEKKRIDLSYFSRSKITSKEKSNCMCGMRADGYSRPREKEKASE